MVDTSNNTAAGLDHTRSQLRQQLQRARASIDADTVVDHSNAIATHVLPLLRDARTVAGYLSVGAEVSVTALMARCRAQGCRTYVPVIKSQRRLAFAPLTDDTPLVTGRFGITEPLVDEQACIAANSLDVVLVPLVGFDDRCARMGMGGGYYDRAFAHRREQAGAPMLIGVAHELQRVPTVYPDWWDVVLDCVATEQKIRYRPTFTGTSTQKQ